MLSTVTRPERGVKKTKTTDTCCVALLIKVSVETIPSRNRNVLSAREARKSVIVHHSKRVCVRACNQVHVYPCAQLSVVYTHRHICDVQGIVLSATCVTGALCVG